MYRILEARDLQAFRPTGSSCRAEPSALLGVRPRLRRDVAKLWPDQANPPAGGHQRHARHRSSTFTTARAFAGMTTVHAAAVSGFLCGMIESNIQPTPLRFAIKSAGRPVNLPKALRGASRWNGLVGRTAVANPEHLRHFRPLGLAAASRPVRPSSAGHCEPIVG